MAKRRRPNKPIATGRNDFERYVWLTYRLLNSIAYRSLSANARALLIELHMINHKANNGSIYLSLRDAATRMGVFDVHTAANAFDELEAAGFITKTSDAHFSNKAAEKSRARTWLLNHLPGPGRRSADFDFLGAQPPAGTANKPKRKSSDHVPLAFTAIRSHHRPKGGIIGGIYISLHLGMAGFRAIARPI